METNNKLVLSWLNAFGFAKYNSKTSNKIKTTSYRGQLYIRFNLTWQLDSIRSDSNVSFIKNFIILFYSLAKTCVCKKLYPYSFSRDEVHFHLLLQHCIFLQHTQWGTELRVIAPSANKLVTLCRLLYHKNWYVRLENVILFCYIVAPFHCSIAIHEQMHLGSIRYCYYHSLKVSN